MESVRKAFKEATEKYGCVDILVNNAGTVSYTHLCGYIYDPAVGDPDGGIAPGTAFEYIPDDWTCPICGLGKDCLLYTSRCV